MDERTVAQRFGVLASSMDIIPSEVDTRLYGVVQASISQTFRRQAEALGKKRSASVTASAYSRRQSNYRNFRGRKNQRVSKNQVSDEEEGTNGNDGSKDSSSADERYSEVKSKRYKRWGGSRTLQQSSGANIDDDNDSEANRELLGASAALIGGTEILPWGRGGMRSNTRHMKINLTLVSLFEGKIPCLKRPFLYCSSRASLGTCYVAMHTSTEADRIEILIVKDFDPVNNTSSFKGGLGILDPCHNELQLLNEHQTLEEIYAYTAESVGRFEILSLTGSFMLSDDGLTKSRSDGLSVSLAGSDVRVLGGGLAGMLVAAGPVQHLGIVRLVGPD
ncbi:hypothetical protein OROMI_026674 [Orobanche minor]